MASVAIEGRVYLMSILECISSSETWELILSMKKDFFKYLFPGQ
jgi:hypothetical protein